MQFAIESKPSEGIQLVPTDPFVAAQMRIKMELFNKNVGKLFKVLGSKGNDGSVLEDYKNTS